MPERLTSIARLVVTAMAAYVIALVLLDTRAPTLAPLTAMLVVQVSLFRTLKHAGGRIVSVGAGVLVSVVMSGLFGLSWWSLGLSVAVALGLGHLLKLREHLLEVPISAMLILQFGTGPAAADRIVETLIGAAVGLVTVFVATPTRLRPAERAIADFGGRVAGLLDDMAAGLAAEPGPEAVGRWMDQARKLTAEIHRVEAAVDTADETARLRGRTLTGHSRALREALDTLERAIPTVRGLARSISDRTGLRMWEPGVRERLASVLHDLAQTTRNYAEAATTCCPAEAERLTGELDRSVTEGRRMRDELGAVLREDPGHWPLHGELLVHLDRLLDGLRDGQDPLVHRRNIRPHETRRPIVSRAADRADRVRARATLRV
ncbi:hypothetical protein GT755_26640 [Herbidospora sp. NEAU-GS84]|uniref:Integral membrane bound transporter domain-containing protein n=1 Tax=Herbidospora solisilvae TaxID=2696284 RepID=A0A7C9J5G0_9ACTN|nr:FUSC family protein [Herbidospora solisilvae]NAS25247.1 hypothetical protein [Herbidospora solisilvae]